MVMVPLSNKLTNMPDCKIDHKTSPTISNKNWFGNNSKAKIIMFLRTSFAIRKLKNQEEKTICK